MTISFVESDTVSNFLDQTQALQEAHWDEIAKNKEVMVLRPDVAQYRELEEAGRLFASLVYDDDQIIGYSVNFLLVNLHYSSLLIAQNDVLFLDKAHRGGRLGIRLMQETERLAAKRGARMVIFHAKEGTPLTAVLPRMGYGVQDILYSRQLEASNFRMFGSFDVLQAGIEITDNYHLFDQFTARQEAPGSAHADTRCIVLRGPDMEEGTLYNRDVAHNVIESADWLANVQALPATVRLCKRITNRLRIKELGRVMLVELAAGGHVMPHADQGAYAEHYGRFHLPITSAVGNTFINGAEAIHMKPGELWQFNHRIEHEVLNHSNAPRIHLIIDAITQ